MCTQVPVLLCFFLALAVARVFMQVYEAVIDSILLCFLVDCSSENVRQMKGHPRLIALVKKYRRRRGSVGTGVAGAGSGASLPTSRPNSLQMAAFRERE